MTRARNPFPRGIVCMRPVSDAIEAAGRASSPREAGGILLGWETADGFELTNALVVPDTAASRTNYTRDSDAAQAVLDCALATQPDGSPLGYIGEWHTHPTPCSPSPTDIRAMRSIARRLSNRPTVLLVAAFRHDGDIDLHGVIATRWRCVATVVHHSPFGAP